MRPNPLKKIFALSALFSLHFAISAYVNSSFLSNVVGEQFVGLLYTVAAFVTLVLLSNTGGILKYFGNKRLTVIMLMLNMFGLVGMLGQNPIIVACSFVLFIVTNYVVFYCLDIFVEHFGNPKSIGKTRGLYLTVVNIGWLLSPLIASYIISHFGGYTAIYTVSFFAVCIMVLGLYAGIGTFTDQSYTKKPFLEMWSYIRDNHHIRAIMVISFLLQFFYVWMVIYTPLYLSKHIGLGWDSIGIIFTIMLVPFVLLSIPIGKLIDNYHIHKRTLLVIGTTIISISTISIAYITTNNIVVWAIVLFLTRVGAATIETVSEIYFFTHVREEDASILSLFRDMNPLAYLIAPVLGTLFLLAFPFKYLFITIGILILTMLYYIKQLKHTKNFYEAPVSK